VLTERVCVCVCLRGGGWGLRVCVSVGWCTPRGGGRGANPRTSSKQPVYDFQFTVSPHIYHPAPDADVYRYSSRSRGRPPISPPIIIIPLP